MDKYVIAPPSGSTQNSVGASDRAWKEGHFDSVKLNGGDLGEYLAESTGYGIVSGCEPSISGLTVTVASGVVHLADGTRKEIAATTVTLDAADSTNPRIDLVYIDSTGAVAKITGTASTSPVVPALPSGGISVCNVTITASATTGTVTDSRGMLSRFYNTGIVNVKDFGAKGDGVTDDYAAFQAAVNCAVYLKPETSVPTKIYVPCGNYLISNSIIFHRINNLEFVCDGSINYSGNDYAITIKSMTNSIFRFTKVVAPNGGCIHFDCTDTNTWSQYINIYFEDFKPSTESIFVEVSGTNWCNENRIYNGRFTTGDYGARFFNSSKINGWVFQNVGIEGCSTGYSFEGDTGNFYYGFSFINNRIEEATTVINGTYRFVNFLWLSADYVSIANKITATSNSTMRIIQAREERKLVKGKAVLNNGLTDYYVDCGINNAQYRGKDLTSYFDSGDMSTAIANGNFSDIFPGDYITKKITIDGTEYTVTWVVGEINYFKSYTMTTPHVLMFAQDGIALSKMNATATTSGGFIGSTMWTTTLPKYSNAVKTAFGNDHVLTVSLSLTNTVDTAKNNPCYPSYSGLVTNAETANVTCGLFTEKMINGGACYNPVGLGYGQTQIAAMRLNKINRVIHSGSYFLADVISDKCFSMVYGDGKITPWTQANSDQYVRPWFLLK